MALDSSCGHIGKKKTELDMRPGNLLFTALLTALVSGCGPTPVVITAELEEEKLGDLEIRLYPFD